MTVLVRFALLLAVLLACAAIIGTHGVRGIAVVTVVALLASLSRTRAWHTAERLLVRVTGSRQRAVALIFALVIGILAAVNVYEYVR